ncbi:MAG: DUF4290 domain-containing protein [Salibacteraceae bacterium]
MEYYTQKEPLVLAEYGRHVQDMVKHMMSLEDREERSKAAHSIVQLMTVMNPSYKGNDELQHKLWDDLHVMANYQLDADAPYPVPTPKEQLVAEKINYPEGKFKYRHYGKAIEDLIQAARKIENKDEQQELTQQIANLMKRSYLSYNRDSVNEQMIIDQLKEMSNGELKLSDDFRFQHTNDILNTVVKRTSKSSKGRGKKKWKKN